jgi:hypothetical protein
MNPIAAARPARSGLVSALAWSLTVLLSVAPAYAAKWLSCPAPPFPVYPSTLGATNSPFVHPGHDLTLVLNEEEIQASGGFAAGTDANRIDVVFHPTMGPQIPLASRYATAAGPESLTFAFPNTADELGRLVVGPVELSVYSGNQLLAHIAAEDLVALPPTNDVTPILLGDQPSDIVEAALGADGDLWIPAHFAGDRMAMPTCPGDFVFPISVQIGAATIAMDTQIHLQPLQHLRGITAYMGDVTVWDYSLYGMQMPMPIRLMHIAGSLGVSICKLNDAEDVVLRIRGDSSWAQCRQSPFSFATADGDPIPLFLMGAPVLPGQPQAAFDSLGNECTNKPVHPGHGHCD